MCISAVGPQYTRHWRSGAPTEASFSIPDVNKLKQTVQEFKSSLRVTPEKVGEIERLTREQRNAP